MSDLVPSPFAFDGENFPVFRMPNGDFGLPLTCLTAPIDISADAQRRLIERSPWSKGRTTKMVVQVPGDTQARKHFVISHRIVPMWVANITASQIKDEEARKRISRWQVELADALYEYVFNGEATNPRALATASVTALPAPEVSDPKTYPMLDALVLMRQRFGVNVGLHDLTRTLRAGGVLRQDGRPMKNYMHLFWLKSETSTYEVFEHAIAPLYHLYESTKLRLQMAAQRALPIDPPGWPELPLGDAS